MEIENNKKVQVELQHPQQTSIDQDLKQSITLLNYNTEQLLEKQKETNHHLKEIRVGITVQIIIMLIPYIILWMMYIVEARTLYEFFQIMKDIWV